MRRVIIYAMKWDILFWFWQKVNGNWDNNMKRISQWRESRCRTSDSVTRKKEIQKCRTLRVTSRIEVGKLTIWVRSFEIERRVWFKERFTIKKIKTKQHKIFVKLSLSCVIQKYLVWYLVHDQRKDRGGHEAKRGSKFFGGGTKEMGTSSRRGFEILWNRQDTCLSSFLWWETLIMEGTM